MRSITLPAIIAPIGISYYTFQAIGYIINVYRKIEPAERHFGYFAIYTLFFPKFLSGPIERSNQFLPQIHKGVKFNQTDLKEGFLLIFWGLFKKLVIAERLSPFINDVYLNLQDHSGISLISTLILQPIYIYCDFSGYTDIALGIARIFGLRLTDNFQRPFFATTVSVFWRRWHISLTSWCNDYIFKHVILKRKRWGTLASTYGVFLAFFIIGIWHGPRWNFIILGILQGIAINYEFYSRKFRLQIASKIPDLVTINLSRLITILFFSFSLIFFFAASFNESLYFLKNLGKIESFSPFGSYGGYYNNPHDFLIAIFAFFVVFVVDFLHEYNFHFRHYFIGKKTWIRWTMYYLLVFIVLIFGRFAAANVIYFQF
ncbi:MBOAT family O-acyltransferase [Bacteroidota bacterium]